MEIGRAAARRTLARAGPLLVARLVGRGLGAAKGVLLARALGPSGYGLLAGATALVGTFSPAYSSALDTPVLREAARAGEGARPLLRRTLGAKALLGGAALALLPWTGALPALLVALVAADSLVVALTGGFAAFLSGRERQGAAALGELLRSLLWTAAAAFALFRGLGCEGAAGAQAAASVVAGIALAAGCGVAASPAFAGLPGVLRAARPFLVSVLFTSIYQQADRLLLFWLGSEAELGHYAAAANLVAALTMLGGALSAASLPTLFRERERAFAIVAERVRLSVLLALPAALALAILREPVVATLFGDGFARAARPLGALAPCLVLRLVAGAYGDYLTALDRQGARNRAQALAALLNVALNAFLIPRWGAVGAAASFVLSDSALAVGCALAARPRRPA